MVYFKVYSLLLRQLSLKSSEVCEGDKMLSLFTRDE